MTDHHLDRDDEWRDLVSGPLDIADVQSLSSAVGLDVGAISSCGPARPHNSDHYLALRFGRLQETMVTSLATADLPPRFEESAYALLVADGLGGSSGGARASRLALSTLAHLAIEYGHWNVRVGSGNEQEIVQQGEFFYRRVNEALREARAADARLSDMATSLTAAYVAGADLFFAHVGHSRAFLFRDGALIQLTRDQLNGAQREPTRLPSPPDQSHVVTETLGSRPCGPDIAIEHVHLWTGDRVLLCTNGLTDVVCDDTIATVLAGRRRPDEDCQRLVDQALACGSVDDVTVLVADYFVRPAPIIVQSGHAG